MRISVVTIAQTLGFFKYKVHMRSLHFSSPSFSGYVSLVKLKKYLSSTFQWDFKVEDDRNQLLQILGDFAATGVVDKNGSSYLFLGSNSTSSLTSSASSTVSSSVTDVASRQTVQEMALERTINAHIISSMAQLIPCPPAA